jgi:hypothetical protein
LGLAVAQERVYNNLLHQTVCGIDDPSKEPFMIGMNPNLVDEYVEELPLKLKFEETDPEITIHPERLRVIIRGALKDSINCHGPVTKNLIGSVLKRIIKQIEVDQNDLT